jgi:hypothetical protein
MNFRCAHSKLDAEIGIADPVRSHRESKRYNNILWLGNHLNTLFANCERTSIFLFEIKPHKPGGIMTLREAHWRIEPAPDRN